MKYLSRVVIVLLLPVAAWAVLFAVAGLFHGYAYGEAIVGAETAPLAAYFLGFALIQFVLTPAGVVEIPDGYTINQLLLVVGLSLTAQVGCSTLLGAALPMLASAAKLDPAIVASPAITTVVDVLGLFIYFGLAAILLGI